MKRRSRTQYPGLKKEYNLKIRQEMFDQDYINKLSDKEKEWLSNFNEEYVSNNFNHKGKKIHRKKKHKKSCSDSNNARNRDEYSKAKSKNMLKHDSGIYLDKDRENTTENTLIELLDLKTSLNKSVKQPR